MAFWCANQDPYSLQKAAKKNLKIQDDCSRGSCRVVDRLTGCVIVFQTK